MPAGEEKHGDIVAPAHTASALLSKLLVLVEGADVRIVAVVHVRRRAVVRFAVAAAFLALLLAAERKRLLLRLLCLLLRLRLVEVRAKDIHHRLRAAKLGLPVVRLRVQLRKPLHELLILPLQFLHLHVLLPQAPGKSFLCDREQLPRMPLPLLV